jgi:hypothetical protein
MVFGFLGLCLSLLKLRSVGLGGFWNHDIFASLIGLIGTVVGALIGVKA